MKVFRHEGHYQRELAVYVRLQERGVREVMGCDVPELIAWDDELCVIEMTIVEPPYVLDFASAYLDSPRPYPDDVLEMWEADKQEQFGERWPEVQAIIGAFEQLGVFLVDVSPSNVCLDGL